MTQGNKIEFTAKPDKIVETILYLSHKLTDLSRFKIVKLIYLADKEHLNQYGRPITFDTMVAMENGPVASMTYDILKQDKRRGIDYARLPFDYTKKGKLDYIENPKRAINKKLFSKSDLAILDKIIEKYGGMSSGGLWDLTHEHAAYKNAWQSRGDKKSVTMRFEDIIEDDSKKDSLIEELVSTSKYM